MERVQKFLAQKGFGSRREIEGWIAAGEILINGSPAVLGSKVDAGDVITVRGKKVRTDSKTSTTHKVIMYHKPEGEICTRSDPEGRVTVFSKLPKLQGQRWVAVGRLDINSSGIILFTTDGELANALMHPSSNIDRVYAVRVLGEVTPQIIKRITGGVRLDDGSTAKFERVKHAGGDGANSWYHVALTEGRYREVRRIWQAVGLQVSRLIRISYGHFKLPKDLPAGKYIEIDYSEVKKKYEKHK